MFLAKVYMVALLMVQSCHSGHLRLVLFFMCQRNMKEFSRKEFVLDIPIFKPVIQSLMQLNEKFFIFQ